MLVPDRQLEDRADAGTSRGAIPAGMAAGEPKRARESSRAITRKDRDMAIGIAFLLPLEISFSLWVHKLLGLALFGAVSLASWLTLHRWRASEQEQVR